MTEHSLSLVRSGVTAVERRPESTRPIDRLDASRLGKHLVVFTPSSDQIPRLVAAAGERIPGICDPDVVLRVMAHNPDTIWGIARRRKAEGENPPQAEGFVSMLPLTREGLKRLANETLDGTDPPLEFITKPGERPAGIYVWATFAPGTLAGGIAVWMERLTQPPYAGVDMFTKVTTPEGKRFTETLGFEPEPIIYGIRAAKNLYGFRRSPHGDTIFTRNDTIVPGPETVVPRRDPLSPRRENYVPAYDTYRKTANKSDRALSVTVARNFEDVMRIVSMRSAVYISEQECPYEEEFDGNDMAATHLLGYVGTEPAGCIRVRNFADFAKIERLAVRKEFRNTRLSFQLVRAAIELSRVKGYRRLYGHAQKRLINFWSRFGFKILEGGKELVFSDFDYVEMVADLERHPDAIAIGADPYKIIRPEGRWHVPGVLEESAQRDVTRPSIEVSHPSMEALHSSMSVS